MPYSLEPQQFNLLLVDDTLENLQLLANILTQEGYSVRKSTSSKLALSFVQRQVPDLILLDINMPDINGYDMCRQLKSVPRTAAVPIIFISALDRLDNKIQAFEVGGSDYITKPFQEQEVLMRVKNQLLIRQQQRQVQSKNEHLLIEIGKRQEIERQLEMKLRQEQLLHQVIQTIRDSLDLEAILQTTVTEARQLLKTDRALIYKADPDKSGMIISEDNAPGIFTLIDQSLPEDIFPSEFHSLYLQGRIRAVEDIEQDSLAECLIATLKSLGVRSKLVAPIITVARFPQVSYTLESSAIAELGEFSESEELTNPTEKEQVSLWGLLVFHQCHQTRQWQADEIELVKQLATQTAIAIQQAELYRQLQLSNQELERLSITDTLTQITNRRGFDDYLQREWRRSARNQTSLALILCDIDYFKQYNDTYGHPLGDDCLFQVAQLLKNQLKRPGDCVARYGGEEFILILPDTDRNGAIQLVESIRQQLQRLNHSHQSSLVASYITLSFGIAVTVPSHQTNLELLIKQADQSLFDAKHQGRNGYVVFNEG